MAGTQRPEGMGSVWIMGSQGSERGLADPEIQGLELRDKPGLEVQEPQGKGLRHPVGDVKLAWRVEWRERKVGGGTPVNLVL